MSGRYVVAIDQGTASSRCLVFDHRARIVSVAQKEHHHLYPMPGWVEHDPQEIWRNVLTVVSQALEKANLSPTELSALGIANQRETTVLWDRRTGAPVHNAINWEDTRTDRLCRQLAEEFGQESFRQKTGLPVSTYFSGPKVRWLLDNIPGLRERAEAGELLFGTMDSWLLWNLCGRHATDVTNASRTLLMSLETLDWDDELLSMIGVPRAMLPEIRPSSEIYGEASPVLAGVPVASVLGDQHAALLGQTCLDPGEAKCTYGTGSFLLLNTGEQPITSRSGLLTTLGYQLGSGRPTYALEGSIAITGALVQWFRDSVGLIGSAPEIETLALTVEDNGGCYFVPAFSGLFAPHWRSDARGVIAGLTGYINKGHLARAVLEATAWQTREVVEAMRNDYGSGLRELRVDGGMTANNLLMQFLADALDVPVMRPIVAETVSLGAAYTAGLAVGFWPDIESLRKNWHRAAEWLPSMNAASRERGYRKWKKAVARTVDWVDDDE
ncbi:MAG TPA: glycerol kinase GlpK [Solirubrobacteraceae bacterium]